MRAFWAGFMVVAVLSLAAVGGMARLRDHHAAPSSAAGTALQRPRAVTADERGNGQTTPKPGTGSGQDRELAAVIDAIESGGSESAFREHTGHGVYGMQSAGGDRAVDRLVRVVRRHIQTGRLRTIGAVNTEINAGASALSDAGYDDVYDTAVLDHIYSALGPALRHAGMDPDELDIG